MSGRRKLAIIVAATFLGWAAVLGISDMADAVMGTLS